MSLSRRGFVTSQFEFHGFTGETCGHCIQAVLSERNGCPDEKNVSDDQVQYC